MKVNKQKLITPSQKRVLDFIRKFGKEKGYSPSLKEVAKHFKKSISTAQYYIRELQERGYLRKESFLSRGISPTFEDTHKIFLLGYIAAGHPIEPIENPEPINVPLSMVKPPGDYYALKVKGNSMIEDGIVNEDVVVIKHQKTANIGETVVAITEKGATLKVFKKKNGKIILEPRNKKLKIIKPKKLEIRGVFCGLLRS